MLYDPTRWVMPEILPEVPKVEPWQQVLLDAAALIEKRGWTRENYANHGRYCAIGAINKVSGLHPEHCNSPVESFYSPPGKRVKMSPARKKAESKLKKYLKISGHMAVENWNDDTASNKKVVVQAMRNAATS